jgi:NADPH-dependent stearoyl-CoA 9-desaturase
MFPAAPAAAMIGARRQRGGPVATEIENPLSTLSPQQLEALGRELEAIRERIRADLGARDRRYIEAIVELHRGLEIAGRALLLASGKRGPRLAGTAALSAAKILENMEIGHNVLHGQWDWMNDPRVHSSTWDWDIASSAEAWKHSHNYLHHTFSNIRGKDRDLGYDIMRVDPEQKWYPFHLLQPLYNLVLAAFFEWAIAVYDLDIVAVLKGEKSKAKALQEKAGIDRKARQQIVKDYVAWPLLSALSSSLAELAAEAGGRGRGYGRRRGREGVRRRLRRAGKRGARVYRATATANATANVIRNVWTYAIIFCGHFPDQTYSFSPEEVEEETTGGWYVRQMLGAANIEGGPFFHVASGHLGYQVEHHLFPDLPSSRYAEIAPQVKDICQRYGLPYNSGPFLQQLGMVQRTILRLALPGGRPQPKPGPYRGDRAAGR